MRSTRIPLLALSVLLLAGCASEPAQEIQAVDTALDHARELEAASYAPDAWQSANDAKARLDAELAAQQERMAMFRSYSDAKQLANQAREAAQTAQERAVEGKQQARDEATSLMEEARSEYQRAQDALASAPRGKGTQADLAALGSDISGIEPILGEMQAAYDAENYMEAKAKAQAAIEAARQVSTEIENAKSAAGRA